jgi:hypothetical protein
MSMTDYYAGPPLTQTGLLALPGGPDPGLLAAAAPPAAAPQLDPTLAFDLNAVAPQHADFTQGQITGQANAPLPGLPPADVSGPGGTTGAVDSILAQAPPRPVNPLSTPEGLAAFNAKFLAENPQPADPNEVKGKGEKGLFANPQYSTKQKWMIGLAALGDIGESLRGKDTNAYATQAAGFDAANKATYDAAIAEHNRAYMQAFAEADPDISPLDKAFFRTADTATLNKALGTHLEAFSLPGGDTRYPGPGAAPITSPKLFDTPGVAGTNTPAGVTSLTVLPAGGKEAAEQELAEARIRLVNTQAEYEKSRAPDAAARLQLERQRVGIAAGQALAYEAHLRRVTPTDLVGSIMQKVQQYGIGSVTDQDKEMLRLSDEYTAGKTARGLTDAAMGLTPNDLIPSASAPAAAPAVAPRVAPRVAPPPVRGPFVPPPSSAMNPGGIGAAPPAAVATPTVTRPAVTRPTVSALTPPIVGAPVLNSVNAVLGARTPATPAAATSPGPTASDLTQMQTGRAYQLNDGTYWAKTPNGTAMQVR